jgi:hypothetical protein
MFYLLIFLVLIKREKAHNGFQVGMIYLLILSLFQFEIDSNLKKEILEHISY